MTDQLLPEAIRLARAGRKREARDLFLRLVALDEENELAWLWLVDLVDDPQDQIIALENALTLNPANEKARTRLQQLLRAAESPPVPAEVADDSHPSPETGAAELDQILTGPEQDLAAAARRYEAAGALEEALVIYQQIVARERRGRGRRVARTRIDAIRRRLALQQPVPLHSTFTVLRLSLGPFFLFLLLVLIQAGYRPWRIPPLWYLASLVVLAGSLLLVGSQSAERHPAWRRLFGDQGLRRGGVRLSLGILGFALVVIPYLGFLGAAIQRLLTTPGVPLPGGG